ncbi:hypothetical protein [Streptomyces sp. NPDC102264]|uniref:hypothetical protein n=1 Tax=Streptomyces sp. NPDC102264 TaxID=3366149 RepID=UPI00381ECCFB
MPRRSECLHTSRRLVLRDSVEDSEIWSFAEQKGWHYLGHVPRDPARGVFYEARWEPTEGSTVHYIIDEFTDVVYMVVQHHEVEVAENLAGQLTDGLPIESLEELARNFDIHMYPAGWAKAVLRLGVGAPKEPDENFLLRIRESVGHPEARVRKAAVWAMRYAAWPEFSQDLKRMAKSESDPEVAKEITHAMETFRTPGGDQA